MRRQISSKSGTCTESIDVDAAGISVKVSAQYPGRSRCLLAQLLLLRGSRKSDEKSAEGIVGFPLKKKKKKESRRPEREVTERELEFR